MKPIKAILIVVMLLGLHFTGICANDYHKNPQAKKVADNILDAYGGTVNILKVSRLKTVIALARGTNQLRMVCYQTPDKLRIDSDQPVPQIQIWDGAQAWLITNGVKVPAPEAVKNQLAQVRAEGVGQQDLVRRFQGEGSSLKYRGLVAYDNRAHHLFESRNAQGAVVRHYYDQKTLLERMQVTLNKSGAESSEFLGHLKFNEVLYPSKIIMRDSQARITGQVEIEKISADFEDSVFAPVAAK